MAEFSAASYEEAVVEAEKKFNLGRDQLEISVIEQGSSGLFSKKPWRIEASMKHIAAPSAQSLPQRDGGEVFGGLHEQARIRLIYTPEGVMLEPDPAISDAEMGSYFARRELRDLDFQTAKKLIARGDSPVQVAPAQQEGPPARDEVLVTFAKDDMTAYLVLYPGDEGGERATYESLMQALTERYKIVCGIDEEKLRRIAKALPYRQEIEIAHGRQPVTGQDATIEMHFRQSHSMRPKLLDGDRVDYWTLDLFESVRKGQVLITRTPPTSGADGESVRGRPLRAKSGKDKQLPRGKGIVVSEDKLQVVAALDGMVTFTSGQVNVASCYIVQGNVDMSTGNIDFVGDVEVRGNVIAGMTVKAEGSVEIHGVVEAASIVAGGNVVLHQGMQGMGKGEVIAGGDVAAKYFERVKVVARGVVTADAIYHSEVNSVEGVMLAGKRASLIGGVTRSAKLVAARTIGSTSNTSTIVEVGILPEQRERYNFLETELIRLSNEREKIALLVRTYGAAPKEGEPADRDQVRQRVLEANRSLLRQSAEATAERDTLRASMESVTGGRVHVLNTIFPGARVVIGSAVYIVENPIDYATFRVMDGDVGFVACEYS